MRKLTGWFALISLLAIGCGPSAPPEEQATTPGAEKSSAPAAMQSPQSQAAAPAATDRPGTNERYYTTRAYLDEGGSFYLYGNVKDVLHDLVAELKEGVGELGVPPAAAAVQIADQVIDRLGIYGVQDIGISVLHEAQGGYLTKSFVGAPEGRRGLLSLLGGEPHTFDTQLGMAPADTLLFVTVDLNLSELPGLVRQIAKDIVGVMGEQQIDQGLMMLKMQSGLDLEAMVRSLDGELLIVGTLDAANKLNSQLPNGQPAAWDRPYLLAGVRVKDSTIYEAIRLLATMGGGVEADESSATLKHLVLKVPANPVWQPQPAVAMEGGYLFVTTDLDYLKRALATRGKNETVATSPEFIRVSRGLPRAGNSLQFVSQRVPEYVQGIMGQVMSAQPSMGRPGEPDPVAVQRLIQRFQPKPGPAYAVRINHPAGIQTIGRSNQSGKQVAAAVMVAPAGLLAAIAVPNFLEAQSRSKVARVHADLRSMATAIESYYIDNNSYPAWSADPQLNAFGMLAQGSPDLAGQPTFRNDYGRGGPMSLTTPISYITRQFADPFSPVEAAAFSFWCPEKETGWILWSPGPDQQYDLTLENIATLYDPSKTVPSPELIERTYNPTNGTESTGDVYRVKQ